MLVGKILLWYVSDIANVVKCCRHNMEFYAFPGLARGGDTEEGGHHADKAEQEYATLTEELQKCDFVLNFMVRTTSKITRGQIVNARFLNY